MCRSICVMVERRPRSWVIPTPEGYDDPPSKVLCSQCGNVAPAVYKQAKTTLDVCMIPCFSYGTSTPFLACSRCNFPFAGLFSQKCEQCDISTFYKCSYCPKCGKNRPGAPNNPNALVDSEAPDDPTHKSLHGIEEALQTREGGGKKKHSGKGRNNASMAADHHGKS